MSEYKAITVRDLVNTINDNKAHFPNGLDTVIMSGDFECNYLHEFHEIQRDHDLTKYGPIIVLGYEMHENYEKFIGNGKVDDE